MLTAENTHGTENSKTRVMDISSLKDGKTYTSTQKYRLIFKPLEEKFSVLQTNLKFYHVD